MVKNRLIPETALTPRQELIAAFIGGAVAVAAMMVGIAVWYSLPASFPFRVERTETGFVSLAEWQAEQAELYPEAPAARVPYPPGGVWRVASEGTYSTICRTVAVHRRFIGDGQSWTQAPIQARVTDLDEAGRAVLTRQTDEVRYVVAGAQHGRRTVFDYAITRPVRLGTYVVEAEAWGCDNGWSGPLPPREIPFQWGLGQ